MDEDLFFLGVKGLIRNEQGDILLLQVNEKKLTKNVHGAYWDIPGGRMKKKDTPGHALEREILEETGLQLKSFTPVLMMLSKIRIPQEHESHGLVLHAFNCEVEDASNITLSEEHTKYEWVSPWKAAELLSVKYPEEFTQIVKNL